MQNSKPLWQTLFCYFTLFCFTFTTSFPIAQVSRSGGGFKVELGALNSAHAAEPTPSLVAPATAFAQDASHAKVLTVARQLSTVLASNVVDGKLSITYRVYNNRPEALRSVLLKTHLLKWTQKSRQKTN
ncbi:MAG: hypothetical protein RL497_1567 [Pseudomonadota bacterium]|jgi:hypothetical protein